MGPTVFKRMTLFLLIFALGPFSARAGTVQNPAPLRLSPPAKAPFAEKQALWQTHLPELIDARGLALLVEDDEAAALLEPFISQWQRSYAKLLAKDPELLRIDARVKMLFADNMAARHMPGLFLAAHLRAVPRAKLQPIITIWLKGLLQRRGVFFAKDLDGLSGEKAADICEQARSYRTLGNLSAWRMRVLLWRYRDSEVKRLHAARGEREAFLTPIRLILADLSKEQARALERYSLMLRNLHLKLDENRVEPYEVFRTLEGLLRGLRYMDTIREATALTGLDHLVMTRLYIQESEFVHQRVSSAGAFSLAQFLNIAVKDVFIFQRRIPGAVQVLKGIESWEELKTRIIDDPRMAIWASCLYFRRVRDGIERRLGGRKGGTIDPRLSTLLTLEMFTMQQSLFESSTFAVDRRVDADFGSGEVLPVPLVVAPSGIPDVGSLLQRWMQRTVRELVRIGAAEQVIRGRLERLRDALAISSYNAGTGTLIKTAKRKAPYQSLSFPLQITENRGYVDGILDGVRILKRMDRMASDVDGMEYRALMRLADRACRRAKMVAPRPK
ncbi:MAG: hypothetical protein JRF33_05680 [Deltaproteobacteria bacterium]|nr:hypothetical protein [Deltaproteobacteria bacterium]